MTETPAQILKDELIGGTWTNYTNKAGNNAPPDIGIVGTEDIQGVDPDQSIYLKNKRGEHIYALNGLKVLSTDNVETTINEPRSSERDNILKDFDAIFLASKYSITYAVSDQPDALTVFKTILNIKIVGIVD